MIHGSPIQRKNGETITPKTGTVAKPGKGTKAGGPGGPRKDK